MLSRVLRRLLTGGIGQPPWDLPERRSGERYLILVADAEAEASGPGDDDPGLTATGWAQARSLAEAVTALGPMPMSTSPQRRSVETGAPLAEAWGTEPRREPALAASEPGPVLDAVFAAGADALMVADPAVVRMVVEAATGEPAPSWTPGPCSRTTVRLGRSHLQLLRRGDPAEASAGGTGGPRS